MSNAWIIILNPIIQAIGAMMSLRKIERESPVGCVRGADIVKLNDVPLRYIKKSNIHKLLTPYDIVIEVLRW